MTLPRLCCATGTSPDLTEGRGVADVPGLTGAGVPLAGNTVSLALNAAAPNTVAFLVVGLSALNAPFKGGVLVPAANIIVSLVTDGSGSFALAAPWPGGIPAGLTTWYQVWVMDAAGPQGFSASNAMATTAP